MRLRRDVPIPRALPAAAGLAVAFLLVVAPALAGSLKPASIFFEFNFTDNDLGVQVFLDSAAWQSLTIRDPGGTRILQVDAQGSLGTLGLTEFLFESAEPSPKDVLALFAAGTYTFEVTGVGGDVRAGTATLSHDLPQPAAVLSPEEDGALDAANAVISWTHPQSNQLAGFQVVIENVTTGTQVAAFSLPASATTVQVPHQALAGPGKKYKVEVIAVGTNGNKTIVEVPFTT